MYIFMKNGWFGRVTGLFKMTFDCALNDPNLYRTKRSDVAQVLETAYGAKAYMVPSEVSNE